MTTAFELDGQPTVDIETKNPITLPSERIPDGAPEDYKIRVFSQDEDDPNTDPRTIEAFWSGEGKVIAELDIGNGQAGLSDIRRPDHWQGDGRPPEEQQPEFQLALEGMIERASGLDASTIEVSKQTGVIAAALLGLKVPRGWERQTKLDYWSKEEVVDVAQAVEQGAGLFVRFEKKPVTPKGMGHLATSGHFQTPEASLAEAA